jgi:hypothetical protein
MVVLAAFLAVGFGVPMTFAGEPAPAEQKEKKDMAGPKADGEQKEKKDTTGGKAEDEKKKDEKKDMGR